MSVMKRLKLIFSAKANKALDRAEDPRETLDYSYERQLEMLQKVRRGVADVATSRKRLELQLQQLQAAVRQARGAGPAGARRRPGGPGPRGPDPPVRRAAAADRPRPPSTRQLQAEEEKLTLASQRLQAKVDAFRTRKETIKATYTAAEAQTKIGEAFSGISEEMGDVGLAVQRAEDKTLAMQARAGAIDELLASGALDDASGTAKDDITAELERDVEQRRRRARAGPAQGRDRHRARHLRRSRAAAAPATDAARAAAPADARSNTVIVRVLGEGQYVVDDAHARPAQRARQRPRARGRVRGRGGVPVRARRPARAGARRGRAAARRRARAVRRACCPDESSTLDEVRALLSGVRRGPHPRLGSQKDSMARTRYVPDRGLSARMGLTMFLLGLLYVVLDRARHELHQPGARPRHRRRGAVRAVVLQRPDRALRHARPGGHPGGGTRSCTASSTGSARWPTCPSRPWPSPTATCPTRSPPAVRRSGPSCARPPGIMRRLDERELEGVLAHELSHVAHRDVTVMTVASFVGVLAGFLTRIVMFYAAWAAAATDNGGPPVVLVVMLVSDRRLRAGVPADPRAVALPRAGRRPGRRVPHRRSRRPWRRP